MELKVVNSNTILGEDAIYSASCNTQKAEKVILKIGTDALRYKGKNKVDESKIEGICSVVSKLIRYGGYYYPRFFYPIIVTSGSLLCGMEREKLNDIPEKLIRKQILAGVGQYHLLSLYDKYLKKHGLIANQILLTHSVFKNKDHRKSLREVIEKSYPLGEIPICNDNDVITPEEMRTKLKGKKYYFDDNDELAYLLAVELKVDSVFFFNTRGGLYDNFGKLIYFVEPDKFKEVQKMVKDRNNTSGMRGGIQSKVKHACNCAKKKIDAFIIHSKYLKKGIDIFSVKDSTVFCAANKYSS